MLAGATPSVTQSGQWDSVMASKAQDVTSAVHKKEPTVDSVGDVPSGGLPKIDDFLIKSASNEASVDGKTVHAECADVTVQQAPRDDAVPTVRVDSKSLVSRLLPKIKTRTKSGNSDVKSRSNVQEARHGRNKISMCCFGGS